MYEPCLCGADDCPACFPGRATRRYPLGSLDAEDIDILNEDAYRAEQAAADEEAELTYRRMLEDEDDAPPVETDLF